MREIFIFAVGASIVGTIFLVSLIELIFTVRRRKVKEELDKKVKEMKTSYNTAINQLVLEEEGKISEVEKELETITSQVDSEKQSIEESYQDKITDIKKEAEKELAAAKAKAKKLEEEAHLKADEYLASRKKEVEQELMNLVMSVTKKVLPEGLTYEVQKDIVIKALKDVKASGQPKP